MPTPTPTETPNTAATPPKRLNKYLADMGYCSRREADAWIARGWVRVNGLVADLGAQVLGSDTVEVQREAHAAQQQLATVLIHKPVGYVSGQPEDGYESAAQLLSPRSRWAQDFSPLKFGGHIFKGLAPAGRLDIDSTGLLVLTQDGRVAKSIICEHSNVEKEYLVRVAIDTPDGRIESDLQSLFPPQGLQLLRHGLALDGAALKTAQVDWQNPEQLRFVLKEGKKRQIRRMCEQVGLTVVGLKRVRIGGIKLGNLPVGEWRFMGEGEGV